MINHTNKHYLEKKCFYSRLKIKTCESWLSFYATYYYFCLSRSLWWRKKIIKSQDGFKFVFDSKYVSIYEHNIHSSWILLRLQSFLLWIGQSFFCNILVWCLFCRWNVFEPNRRNFLAGSLFHYFCTDTTVHIGIFNFLKRSL